MTETRPEGRRGPPQRREGRTTLRRAGSYPHLRGFTPRFVGFTIEHMFIMVGPRSGVALKTGGTPATVGSRGSLGVIANGQSLSPNPCVLIGASYAQPEDLQSDI